MSQEDFSVQIASVYGLEPEIFQSATALAIKAETNLGFRPKVGYAGANDLLYVLADLDFWREVLPFAGKAVVAGTLGAVGKTLWDRLSGRGVEAKVDNLTLSQQQLTDAFSHLSRTMSKIPRYWEMDADVRFGFPTVSGQRRGDVGFAIRDPDRDPALAILALNLISQKIADARERARREMQSKGNDGQPQVEGIVTIEADGRVSAQIRINGGENIQLTDE